MRPLRRRLEEHRCIWQLQRVAHIELGGIVQATGLECATAVVLEEQFPTVDPAADDLATGPGSDPDHGQALVVFVNTDGEHQNRSRLWSRFEARIFRKTTPDDVAGR